jgi:putative DNA primase/helicase
MELNKIAEICKVKNDGWETAVWDTLERKKDQVDRDGNIKSYGKPYPKISNAVKILLNDSRWDGRIRYNEFKSTVDVDETEIIDENETGMALWLDRVYGLAMPTNKVAEAVRYVARKNTFHPVREYLDGLQWDMKPRTDNLFEKYFGTSKNDLYQELGKRWMIGMVARIFDPGCKVDTVVILSGPQGIMKSTALKTMAVNDEWFSDSALDMRSKDAYQALSGGIWIYELAELASIRPREAETVKAFLSSRQDRFRPSYGRNMVTRKRQTVFAGTTNEAEFLSDNTGNRRWHVIKCGLINIPKLHGDIDQLWAEAVHQYKSNERWWLDANASYELEEYQQEFRQQDSWEHAIARWLASKTGPFTVWEVLEKAIGKEAQNHSKSDCMRAAAILRSLDCEKGGRTRLDGKQVYPWVKKGYKKPSD